MASGRTFTSVDWSYLVHMLFDKQFRRPLFTPAKAQIVPSGGAYSFAVRRHHQSAVVPDTGLEWNGLRGPKAASGDLLHTCTSTRYGTACLGSIQASTRAQTAIITFAALTCTGGGTPCSKSGPNTAAAQFNVTDSPVFKPGGYSTVINFTISAT